MLLLSRADQRSFTREHVDLSLVAEEATETLLPLAEAHGVTIETPGDITPIVGSHALLLQMTTNLLQNAIVHNLPEHGMVQVDTAIAPDVVLLTVEKQPHTRGAVRLHGHADVADAAPEPGQRRSCPRATRVHQDTRWASASRMSLDIRSGLRSIQLVDRVSAATAY